MNTTEYFKCHKCATNVAPMSHEDSEFFYSSGDAAREAIFRYSGSRGYVGYGEEEEAVFYIEGGGADGEVAVAGAGAFG